MISLLYYLGHVLAVEKSQMTMYEMYSDLAKLINKQQCDMGTGKGSARGISLLPSDASISFGPKKDVKLSRDGEDRLKISAKTIVMTGDLKSTTTDSLLLKLAAQEKIIKTQSDMLKTLLGRLEKLETGQGNSICYRFQGTACMHSSKADYPDAIFQSTMTGDVIGIRLYHSTGYVTCNKNSGGDVNTGSGRVSHWGCGPADGSMGVFVTDIGLSAF